MARRRPPLDPEFATDVLSAALAAPSCVTGVHVCGAGELRIALAAGPDIVHVDVDVVDSTTPIALSRFLDGGGWVVWGAVPTHGPIGEHPSPLWKALLEVWCELTRRGCDPVRLRQQALVAPACGLAGHGPSQAERAMMLAGSSATGCTTRPRQRSSRSAPNAIFRAVAAPAARVVERVAALRELIDYHTERYFVFDDPELSDAEFDALVPRAARARGAAPRAGHARLADATTGRHAASTFAPVEHRVRMLSLDNAFSFDDLPRGRRVSRSSSPARALRRRAEARRSRDLAAVRERRFTVGATRGDGVTGEDVTENLRTIARSRSG